MNNDKFTEDKYKLVDDNDGIWYWIISLIALAIVGASAIVAGIIKIILSPHAFRTFFYFSGMIAWSFIFIALAVVWYADHCNAQLDKNNIKKAQGTEPGNTEIKA